MTTPVTECAYITLKPGVDLEGDTSEVRVWQESLSTIAAQDGYQKRYYGRQLENPNVMMLLIGWDSHGSHLKFIAAPEYAAFKAKFSTLMEDVHLHHVAPVQFPPSVLGLSPCIEMATFYDCEPDFIKNVEEFSQKMTDGKPKGLHGLDFGEVVESIKKGGDGKEGKAVVLWIGWDSKEAHMEFRDAELFKEIIGLLRVGNGGAEVFHVQFNAQ